MRKQWTSEEEEYLEAKYYKKDLAYIAKKLNRSIYSVKRKACKLDLNAYIGNDLSAKFICQSFSCDSRVILRWIEKFNMPCNYIQRGKIKMYLINPTKFWVWAYKNRSEINWSNYEEKSILPEPSWVRQEIVYYNRKKHRKPILNCDRQQIAGLKRSGESIATIANKTERTQYAVKHILLGINKQTECSSSH